MPASGCSPGPLFALGTCLHARQKQWNIRAYTAQTIRVAATRYRIPDLSIVAGPEPDEQIFTTPPFVCIEILSPDDRMEEVQEKIDEYLAFGVRYVWLINPRSRRAYVYTAEGIGEAKDGLLRTQDPELSVPLAEVFEGL
ncbi:MAG: Uma2 family endonuclease [Acidobacteriota bacterium]